MSLQSKLIDPITGVITISAHDFIAAIRLHAYRAIDNVNGFTRTELDTTLNLDAAEQLQMTSIINRYNTLVSVQDKLVYLQVLEDTAIALQNGWIDSVRAAGLLGL